MSLLKVENLKTIYRTQKGNVTGIEDVSFTLQSGRSFGIVGESGCGKSTLLKSIIGVLPANAYIADGQVTLKDQQLTHLSDAQMSRIRWKEISMITQSALNALDPVYTVGYQITEAILAHSKMDKKTARKRVEEMFSLVGIDVERYGEYPHQYSGGMRQRAIIAMSLILNPSIVIADEPTTSLDVIVQDQIFKNIKNLQNEIGFTLLLVTHDIALVIENCDELAVMYGGRIMETGPMGSVIKNTFHPYTMGLKNAFPNIHDAQSELISIPGVPPSLLGKLKGCRFASRCPFADLTCRKKVPPLVTVGYNHQAACHHLAHVDSMRIHSVQPHTWQGSKTNILKLSPKPRREKMPTLQINEDEAIYFAYGTLLELASMQKYCPSAQSLGIYRLKNYRLDFKMCSPDPTIGGCTLIQEPGNIMYGVLYKMPKNERRELDKVSGLDQGLWAQLDITLVDENDQTIPANTYIIPNPSGPQSPSTEYVRPIIAGAAEIQLPQGYIDQLTRIIKESM